MRCQDLIKLTVASAFMSFISIAQAQAAPQILAVLETDVGIPFICDQGICTAQLSTYCLQRERPAPSMGTVYLPAAADDFTLTLNGESTAPINLPAAKHVSFIESRGFMSVAAVIFEKDLEALGGTDAVIKVASNASMLPEPVPNDPNPLTEKEIAYATQSLRQQGSQIADNTPQASAALLLARVMQTLPIRGLVPNGGAEQIWQNEIGDELPGETIQRGGFIRARDAYGACISSIQSRFYGGFRRCLEFKHDDLIRDINIDYWDSRVGS